MLTRVIRWQLTIFAVVTTVAMAAVAIFFLRVPEAMGIGTYSVTADFPASGGIYKNANVTYRGTTIGRVTAVSLTDDLGVQVQMRLDSETAVPADVTAAVKSVSAIGEQYVDLLPPNGDKSTALLRNQSTIDRAHTSLSGDVAGLLREAQNLVNSLDRSRLSDVLRETSQAFDGAGPELARIIDSTKKLIDALNNGSDDTTALIDELGPVLDAQIQSGASITSLADGLARFTTALRKADPQVRTLLQQAPSAADAATRAFKGISPSFPMLAANLANLGRIGVIYNKSIEQVLVVMPALTAVLINIAEQEPADEGVKVDFKLSLGDTAPCNVGFLPPTQIRSPADDTLRQLPLDMYCKVPFNNPSVVRGARNYPCQEFPGKRAPTVALCRDPQGYQPSGNIAWRGPQVPLDTPITDPRNILPPNKFPNLPPDADYDPGAPVVSLPPGVPPGPGPAETPPYPLQVPPVTPGPPPPPLPYTAPPGQQIPPYGQQPANPVPLPAEGGGSAEAPTGAESQEAAPALSTYDQHSGRFQDTSGNIAVFAPASTSSTAQSWDELMVSPQPSVP